MIINELVLLTRDLPSTEEFYSKILAMRVLNKSEKRISFLIGHTVLTFIQTKETNPFYHFAFSIPSNKLDEAHEYIAAKTDILPFTPGITIANFSNWNAHAFYFHDNQHNIVEFIAHHDLPNSSDMPFTSSSVIGVCEIGIPVDDVFEACKKFLEEYEVPYYVKGPNLQDFAVMGDEYGLFIVTKTGRGWLPTQRPAERYFTRVVFESNSKTKNYLVK